MHPESEKENLQNLKLLFESIGFENEWQQKIPDLFSAIIYVYDAGKKKLTYINNRITDILGYTYNDIKGWDNDIRKVIFKEDIELVEKELEKYYELKENETHEYNCRFNHKDGNWRYFKTLGTILKKNENGMPQSFLFIAQDISGQRLLGQTKDITHSELTELELRQNIKTLNESNKELEEFAYVASHDMQEPLRKIQTFAERLQTKYSGTLADDGKEYLTRIMASAEIMRNLIDNLLEFSRITRRTHPPEPTDLNAIVKVVITELELLFDETNAKVEIQSKLPFIEAIPLQMKQLFTNLITNAIKFRKKDTASIIKIFCRPTNKEERNKYRLSNNANYYSIHIEDNGIGFEQDYAEKIFQIFQRLHGKSEYPGSGIGLAICKKIIDHHHGAIYANSDPQKGATFTVILPLIQIKTNAATEE